MPSTRPSRQSRTELERLREEVASLRERNEDLRLRREEAEQTLEAIRTGQVESLVIEGPEGPHIFSLEGAAQSYRVLVETMNEGAATLTDDGTILYCNGRFARLVGAPLERTIGSSLRAHVPERHRPSLARLLERAGVDSAREELALAGVEGEEIPVYLSLSRVVDGTSRVICAVATDLRERKKSEALLAAEREARQSEARFRSLFESSVEAVLMTRPDGSILAANPRAWSMFGWSERELCARGRAGILDASDPRLAAALEERRRTGRVRALELTAVRANGERFPVEVDSVVLPGEPGGAFVVMRDITERKRAEAALRSSKAELEQLTRTLEDRVRERTADVEHRVMQLRQLHTELARVEQKERKRLATLLHDGLQQLLVAAKMRVNMARGNAGEAARPSLAAVDELLSQSIAASRSLTMELSPPVLSDRGLVAALRWLARYMLEKHELTVDVLAEDEAEPPTEDLRLLLFEAARELLFNVTKHARVDSASICLRREGEEVCLEIRDRGRGFDARRRSEQARGAASFGLFSIEQRLEWIGARMQIRSAPGHGTQVELHVPAAPPRAAVLPTSGAVARPPGPADVAAASSQPRRLRVLLADDHEIVRDGLVSVLAGCDDLDVVAEAADGEQAVELARRHDPDVVVMDVSMPRLNGIEATRRITAEQPGVSVIGLSMHDSADLAGAMREAGAVGYLRKDGPVSDLIGMIRSSARPAT